MNRTLETERDELAAEVEHLRDDVDERDERILELEDQVERLSGRYPLRDGDGMTTHVGATREHVRAHVTDLAHTPVWLRDELAALLREEGLA